MSCLLPLDPADSPASADDPYADVRSLPTAHHHTDRPCERLAAVTAERQLTAPNHTAATGRRPTLFFLGDQLVILRATFLPG